MSGVFTTAGWRQRFMLFVTKERIMTGSQLRHSGDRSRNIACIFYPWSIEDRATTIHSQPLELEVIEAAVERVASWPSWLDSRVLQSNMAAAFVPWIPENNLRSFLQSTGAVLHRSTSRWPSHMPRRVLNCALFKLIDKDVLYKYKNRNVLDTSLPLFCLTRVTVSKKVVYP